MRNDDGVGGHLNAPLEPPSADGLGTGTGTGIGTGTGTGTASGRSEPVALPEAAGGEQTTGCQQWPTPQTGAVARRFPRPPVPTQRCSPIY